MHIVRTMVEQLEGKIWFESQEGKGTTFFVELPKE
ncbi:signal transduction histidine kinase [Flammeovirgaceae bacterium 311]|nr:signal transduction histidine kinase [Flammeovirgaceae bacterium 311]